MAEPAIRTPWKPGVLEKRPNFDFKLVGLNPPQHAEVDWGYRASETPSGYKIEITDDARLEISKLLVSPSTGQHVASINYRASMRRRRCIGLAKELAALAQRATQEDFVVYVHPVTDGIRKLLIELADSPSEGDTREIARRLRDTFLDGGWNHYREKKARDVASDILHFLGQAESVTPEDADRFFDLMLESGLKPESMPLLTFSGEDDEENEEEQIPD